MCDPMDPIDVCGCGDIGYLTTRKIPIDLAHGVGYIDNVPVYHCQATSCQEYTLPPEVSRRLEDIAEEMERTQTLKATYTGTSPRESSSGLQNHQQTLLEAFTLKFRNRVYEDAQVIFVVPGEAVFLQSTLENSEFYVLRYEDDNSGASGLWFSLSKFYYEEPNLTYEDFLDWSESGYIKEIGRVVIDDVEDTLIDEFGDWAVNS
ncbi:hypothetical protein REC12_21080 [Desulfosporosinus sp. PR]|uniref:hypothetical protein n=1 Tax=Candidatus Desulfosporosinus nitrosoreducens TaxID=3401928 RepID=UPI0028001F2B|nr:hypothetical protein [Desulfosporosinus sp. PR]MDQ7096094.1 hypothetical protein [Desulfosporosinus sp. PR]